VSEALRRALDALERSTRALGDAVSERDPVALATALDTRVEAVEWLRSQAGPLPDEAAELMARVARDDEALEARAQESLATLREELAQLRTARESLRSLGAAPTRPRFVSRRA